MKTPPHGMPRSDAIQDVEEGNNLLSGEDRLHGSGRPRQQSTKEAAASLFSSYFSRRFMSGW